MVRSDFTEPGQSVMICTWWCDTCSPMADMVLSNADLLTRYVTGKDPNKLCWKVPEDTLTTKPFPRRRHGRSISVKAAWLMHPTVDISFIRRVGCCQRGVLKKTWS